MKTKMERLNLSLSLIKALYEQHKTIQPVADMLQISGRTVRKYLKAAGVELKRGVRKGTILHPRHHSCLAKWIRKNPTTRLPRRVSEIARLTGCRANAVKTYLYRRRKEVRDAANAIPWSSLVGTLKDTTEHTFPCRAIRECRANVDPYTLLTELSILTYAGTSHLIRLSLEEVQKWQDKNTLGKSTG